jgi:serine/threonine-protein kinase
MPTSDEPEPTRLTTPDALETPVEPLWQRWRQDRCPDFLGPDAGGPSDEEALGVLRFDQCQQWRAGVRIPAEFYVQSFTVLRTDPDQALVLIYGEYLLRQELGESPALDEYVRRFPDHSDRLRRQDEFHRAVEGSSWLPADLAAPAALPSQAGACRIVGEIGRGGMGVILRGHDEQLGRDLAVKVLRDEYRDQPFVVSRFLEEAQVSGQLQHPGVVPVHELGRFADGRPYFTMKLVQGRTLAELLAERASPADDLPRLLKVFEQVCQTVAYAHSKGVIHRDLKPSNVMVGAFGEVQVMDWGLAKRIGAHDQEENGSPGAAIRSPGPERTAAGAALGTPAYMAPEQARGAGRVDEQSDVFGLGAVLCEILTGNPPFAGRSVNEVMSQAERGDLADAFARLGGCGADAELAGFARGCLAAAPADRPRDAGVVAGRVTAYLAGVQERLRRADLERAAAQARAAAERRARRLTVGLAAAVLALGVAGGGSWWLLERKTAAAVRAVAGSLEASTRLQAEERWPEALALVRGAEAALPAGAPADLRGRVVAMRDDLGMVIELEELRLIMVDNRETADRGFTAAFRAFGIDVEALEPAAAAGLVSGRAVRDQLVAALDDWAFIKKDPAAKGRLMAVAREADPDDWRNALRDAILRRDLPALTKLADSGDLAAQPARTLVLLGNALENLQRGGADPGVRLRVLQRARRQYPGDLWANAQLAGALDDQDPPRLGEAIRYYTAAVALRPRSHTARMNLAYALERTGALEDAVTIYQESLALKPDFALTHLNLGNAYQRQKNYAAAEAEFRKSIRLDPLDATAHYDLGNCLWRTGRLEEAAAAYREAIRLDGNLFQAHSNLGGVLDNLDRLDEAVAAHREAVRVNPRDEKNHNNLAASLERQGRRDEAVAAYREAVRVKPDYAAGHFNLGKALHAQGRFAEALESLRRGHELGRKDPRWGRPSAEWVKRCERSLELDGRLAAVLAGEDEPPAAEGLEFAELCLIRERPAAAARLFADAFAAETELADDLEAGHRYAAACAAARAASGQGADAAGLAEEEVAWLRARSLAWLSADLAAWRRALASNPAARPVVSTKLANWQTDPDLARVRAAEALAALPGDERAAWQGFWAEVADLRRRAAGSGRPAESR